MTDEPRAAGSTSAGSTPDAAVPAGPEESPNGERIVIRDKRKIKVTAGKGRSADPAGEEPAGAGEEPGPGSTAESDLAEDAAATAAGPEADRAGQSSTLVVDDIELVEVLEAETPAGADAPVVDAPAKPVSGAGEPVSGAPVQTGPADAELAELRAELEERTRDLQRVTAEYANYRKRVDRDRGVVAEQATGNVLSALLPILDGLDRAREHGDLVGAFGAVAEQLLAELGKLGLTAFGEKGDAFDPTRHEAVAHRTSPEVTEPTCVEVMRRGYLLNDRLLRAALVAVADPE
jgi:molecular chaperone GrpE